MAILKHFIGPRLNAQSATSLGEAPAGGEFSLPAEAICVPGFPNVLEPAPSGRHGPNLLHSSMSAKMYAYRGAFKTVDP